MFGWILNTPMNHPLREKCPNTEFFLVRIFPHSNRSISPIQSECRKIRTRTNSIFGHFSRSDPVEISQKVIRQKSESQNGFYKKAKHGKFSEKRTFFTPDKHTFICLSGSKKCLLIGKFHVLCFLVTLILRFDVLSYYRRKISWKKILKK